MAAVAPLADQATDLIQKISLEPKTKGNDSSETTKKVGSTKKSGVPNALVPPYERSFTPLLQEYIDASMGYTPNGYPNYYYGGIDGSVGEWEDPSRYLIFDGMDRNSPGFYGDMYHNGYGYAQYAPYPSPTLGPDGQLYGLQHYQFPAPCYQPPAPANALKNANQTPSSKGDAPTSVAAGQPPVSAEAAKASTFGTAKGNTKSNNGSVKPKSNMQNQSFNSNGYFPGGVLPVGLPASGYEDPRFGLDGLWSPLPWGDSSLFPDGQQRPATTTTVSSAASHTHHTSSRNQNNRSFPHLMNLPDQKPNDPVTGIFNRMHTNNMTHGQSANIFSNPFWFGPNFYDSRSNGRWGTLADNKYKNRVQNGGFYFGNEKLDGLTELNRGPRADRLKSQKGLGQTITLVANGQSLPEVVNVQNSTAPDKDQYNKAEFPDSYSDAKFFIIKSYSEDDVHKSVKYNVWASTSNGNKKLDAAYQETLEKTSVCPVFLFFSVNTSGQFVGVAEMVGPVDFDKTVEYWQQDKWTGCFPVKWHIVKDVPNSTLKHIILEYNENKPVTNSRDTQEVKLDQGLQMLKIFKEYSNKTSILDDFDFYESRQNIMQEKRTKQQLQRKVMELQPVAADGKDKAGLICESRLEAPAEVLTVLKECAENGVPSLVEDSKTVD